MNDRSDFQVTDCIGDLMSEINSKRLKEAEGTLLIGDGTPIWLDNVLTSLAGSSTALEQAFLAIVYILMYESGFYFINGPQNGTNSYDIQLMKLLNDSTIILKNIKKENSQYITVFSHNLMYPKSIKLVAYTITNIFKEPLLVVNFLLPEENKVDSFIFDIKPYICTSPSNKLQIVESSCKELSVKLKNFLYSYKSLISGETYHPHHILALPLHILQSLCKYLDGRSFAKFIQTCKYMYETFSDDEILWRFHSWNDYRGLNKLPNETWKSHYKYQAQKTLRREIRHHFYFDIF